MEINELEQLTRTASQKIEAVATFIQQELGKVNQQDIEVKSLNSLVSYVDKNAEIQLVEHLGKLLPEATFLTEEETVKTQSGKYRWIIDPLDGTTNFLHQLPFFAISVALEFEEKIVAGVIYEVCRNDCFYAWKNGGAYLNDRPIRVSSTTQLSDALVATGFPYHDYGKVSSYFKTLEFFMRNTRGIRRMGSAALDLAYVACGRFDAFFEYSLNAWDVAAGALIVKEAGGVVSDFSGGDHYIFGEQIIACAPQHFDEILKTVKTSFSKNT